MNNEQSTQVGTNFLTNDQIAAGAAIECDHGAPIGRNVAIDVFDAMRAAAPVAAQTEVLVAIRAALGDQYDPAAGEAMSVLRVMNAWKAEAELGEKYKQMALGAAQAGQVARPEGWKLVPVEPTPEMMEAALGGATITPALRAIADVGLQKNWRSMLAAAPSAPAVAQQAPAQAAPAASQITDTTSARKFVDDWHRKHFPTDRTFSRYIMADPARSNPLAGDFAWQLAKALESLGFGAQASTPDGRQEGGAA